MTRKIIPDTNLLLLFIIGLTDGDIIKSHKRARQFTLDDFQLLDIILGDYDVIVTTPHVLSETSNLLRQINDPDKSRLMASFSQFVVRVPEIYFPGKDTVSRTEFARLGFTDANLLDIGREGTTILTVDAALHIASAKENYTTTNFNHLRDM